MGGRGLICQPVPSRSAGIGASDHESGVMFFSIHWSRVPSGAEAVEAGEVDFPPGCDDQGKESGLAGRRRRRARSWETPKWRTFALPVRKAFKGFAAISGGFHQEVGAVQFGRCRWFRY